MVERSIENRFVAGSNPVRSTTSAGLTRIFPRKFQTAKFASFPQAKICFRRGERSVPEVVGVLLTSKTETAQGSSDEFSAEKRIASTTICHRELAVGECGDLNEPKPLARVLSSPLRDRFFPINRDSR